MGNCQYQGCKQFIENGNLSTTEPNIIDQINQEFNLTTDDQNTLDPFYGDIDILELKNSKYDFKLARKVFDLTDKGIYKQLLQQYEAIFYGLNHPNLLIIHTMQNKRIEKMFKTYYRICLYLDYPSRTFGQEILYRKEKFFKESELLYFIDSLVGGLAQLQSKQKSCGNLSLETIYLVKLLNGELGIKVKNPLHTEEYKAFDRLCQLIQQDEYYQLEKFPFLSPEQCTIISNNSNEKYDEFKSEVFTLGMIILELATRRKSIDLYDGLQVNIDAVNENIQRLDEKYSESIQTIVKVMLTPDPKLRCDFLELDDIINSTALKGKRIASNWSYQDYQYCINHIPHSRPQNVSKTFSLTHPELPSQLSNQSKNPSRLSIRQVISEFEASKESKPSNYQKKESYSPQQTKKTLFKKYETELLSKAGSKKTIQFQDGYGIEVGSDGLTYEGQFLNGKKHGKGKLLNDENKVIYDGYFSEGRYHRNGCLINEYPELLETPFDYQDFNNLNQYWTKYDGDFQTGLKHGYGTYSLTNGERYIGQFADNRVHGHGTYFQLCGTQIAGQWSQNILLHI